MADKLYDFVVKLAKRTSEGKVNWERTASEGVFQAAFPSYTVKLFMRPSRHTQRGDDVAVEIYDEDGSVVESTDEVELRGSAEDGGEIYRLMEEMYRRARRKALGLDKALDALMAELGDEDLPF